MNKRKLVKLVCLLLAVSVLLSYTNTINVKAKSNTILTLSNQEFGLEDILNKEISGPPSFFVTGDETVYILDSLNYQVIVCKNNSIVNKISYDTCIPAIDIYVKNRDTILLLSINSILIINGNGETVDTIIIPQIEENSYQYKIYNKIYKNYYKPQCLEVENDSIFVTFQNYKKFIFRNNIFEEVNQEYEVKLNNGKPYAKRASLLNNFDVNAEPILISYLKKDNSDNHYIRLVEMGNMYSGITLDDTVRVIRNGKNVGVAQLQNNYLYQPNKTVVVTNKGNIYEMVVDERKLIVSEVKPRKKYVSRLTEKNLKTEDFKLDSTSVSVSLDPYFVWKAIEAYVFEENTYWSYNSTYNGNKNVTDNPAEVEQPHQLKSLNDGNDHEIVGIPYCWGGSDTPDTFQYKISRRTSPLYYAGNIDAKYSDGTFHNYIGGTAGVDCSGFVCNVFGIPRLSTRDLIKSSYFSKIGDWKQGETFDILLKEGHVMILNYYNIVNGQAAGCYVWESTTRDGVDQVLANYHNVSYAKDFNIYRYKDWQ